MATRILLIRHASVDAIGRRIVGRMPDIHLNARGREESEKLVSRLEGIEVDAIYSSPLERTRETAEVLARARNIEVSICEWMTEIDFGEWTSKSFSELDEIPDWHRFNRCRGQVRIPGGESMLDVQQRMVRGIEELCDRHEGKNVALFSHGDPIRVALAQYAGMAVDFMQRLIVEPASVSVVDIDPCGPRILALNDQSDCGALRRH